MEFVPESIINQTISELEKGMDIYENALVEFYTEQPGIGAYLLNEDFNSLSEGERDIMLYLTLIVYRSAVKVNKDLSEINIEDIESAEDANWALLENITSFNFQERLDVFFDSTPQEDLLALIEDAIMEEEELLTKEGREPIFVGVKSIVDVLDARE
ncbi:MAG TPA: hypothetical protein VK590_11130 [Saprospiraceae bacterium]|nr:hypothetical protein [Saprospiraceae bacterium]